MSDNEEINKLTSEASLWELIGFPIGFIVGIVCAVIVTAIIKGWGCVA